MGKAKNQGGDTAHFEHLLEQHRGILFKVANTYCWQAEDKADLLQEMAAQLWQAWPRFDPDRTFSTWMYRIALNVAITYVREHSTRKHHLSPITDGHQDLATTQDEELAYEAEQKRDLLHAFIQKQTLMDRALLLLYLEERTQRDIADILGLSESNVSTKISRLKQRLGNEL